LTGEPPDWYLLIRAARYLGVPPWELATMPAWWMQAALASENAEIHGENERNKRASQQRRARR